MKHRKRVRFLFFLPRTTRQPIYLCFIFLFLLTIASIIAFPGMQNQIPLFYSLAKSNDQLVHKAWIFIFPSLSLLFISLNTLILALIKHAEPFALKLFAWATFVLQITVGMTFVRLILITH